MRDRTNILWFAVVTGLFLFAAWLRLTGLENNPPGFWQDEASTGVDAWLIWNTGYDRAGDFLPLIARSFGDYPLAGYRYLAAPIVGLFGPTIGHQRLVAAIFGTGLVGAAAIIVAYHYGRAAAIGTMIAGALCPTWLHFSRYGSEAILLPASLAMGWAAFTHAFRTERWRWLWIGTVMLGFSAYTYHAVKLFLPLWMAAFLWLHRPQITMLWRSARRRHVIGPALLFALIVLPSVYLAFSAGGLARGRTVLAWQFAEGTKAWRLVINNYLSYFDPGMLFVRGGPAAAQSIPGLGMWNFIELPLIVAGFYTAFRKPEIRRVSWFVLFWFLLGPLPGGVTFETQNMGRAIGWLPAPQILSGIGAGAIGVWAWRRVKSTENKTLERVIGGGVGVLLLAGWITTAYAVYWSTLVRYPRIAERDFQFDVSRSLNCARLNRTKERVVISPGFQLGSVFAQFLYGDLDRASASGSVWEMGERTTVGANELYVFPVARPAPKRGREVCRIMHFSTGKAVAFVYGAPQEPVAPSAKPTLNPAKMPNVPSPPFEER